MSEEKVVSEVSVINSWPPGPPVRVCSCSRLPEIEAGAVTPPGGEQFSSIWPSALLSIPSPHTSAGGGGGGQFSSIWPLPLLSIPSPHTSLGGGGGGTTAAA